jgi:hypothetical protein
MAAYGAGVASTVVTLIAIAFQVGLASAASAAGQPALVGTMDALWLACTVIVTVARLGSPRPAVADRRRAIELA